MFIQTFAIAVGAGLVSAFLFLSSSVWPISGSLLALLSPLPIMTMALGWRHRWGLVAVIVAGIIIAAVLMQNHQQKALLTGGAFILGFGIPGWLLAYLSLLARRDGDQTEWFSVGKLICVCGLIPCLVVPVMLSEMGSRSYEVFQTETQTVLLQLLTTLQASSPSGSTLKGGLTPAAFAEGFTALLPFLSGMLLAVIFIANLYLAGKLAISLKRLPRPWPMLDMAASPPASTVFVFAVGISASYLLDGYAGAFGSILTAGMVTVFCTHALIVLHALSRRRPARKFMLTSLYVTIFLFTGMTIALLCLIGIADIVFDFRRRSGPKNGATPSNSF